MIIKRQSSVSALLLILGVVSSAHAKLGSDHVRDVGGSDQAIKSTVNNDNDHESNFAENEPEKNEQRSLQAGHEGGWGEGNFGGMMEDGDGMMWGEGGGMMMGGDHSFFNETTFHDFFDGMPCAMTTVTSEEDYTACCNDPDDTHTALVCKLHECFNATTDKMEDTCQCSDIVNACDAAGDFDSMEGMFPFGFGLMLVCESYQNCCSVEEDGLTAATSNEDFEACLLAATSSGFGEGDGEGGWGEDFFGGMLEGFFNGIGDMFGEGGMFGGGEEGGMMGGDFFFPSFFFNETMFQDFFDGKPCMMTVSSEEEYTACCTDPEDEHAALVCKLHECFNTTTGKMESTCQCSDITNACEEAGGDSLGETLPFGFGLMLACESYKNCCSFEDGSTATTSNDDFEACLLAATFSGFGDGGFIDGFFDAIGEEVFGEALGGGEGVSESEPAPVPVPTEGSDGDAVAVGSETDSISGTSPLLGCFLSGDFEPCCQEPLEQGIQTFFCTAAQCTDMMTGQMVDDDENCRCSKIQQQCALAIEDLVEDQVDWICTGPIENCCKGEETSNSDFNACLETLPEDVMGGFPFLEGGIGPVIVDGEIGDGDGKTTEGDGSGESALSDELQFQDETETEQDGDLTVASFEEENGCMARNVIVAMWFLMATNLLILF